MNIWDIIVVPEKQDFGLVVDTEKMLFLGLQSNQIISYKNLKTISVGNIRSSLLEEYFDESQKIFDIFISDLRKIFTKTLVINKIKEIMNNKNGNGN